MKLSPISSTGVVLALSALALTACGGGGGSNGSGGSTGGGEADYVDGATFNLALSSDPGNLDPQMGAGSALFAVSQFAYDPLVSVDGETGEIGSQLAEEWSVDGTTVTLTLAEGITCADGDELTASDVADSLNFVTDPENQSPLLGTFIPVGAKAKGDDGTRTVTLTLATPSPFVLNGLGSLPIVCPGGAEDRAGLAQATSGTGPYELTEAAPGASYTYTLRKDYTWGPGGAGTDEKGLPAKVVVQVVENETTAANLLLSGGLNAAQIAGPDGDRLEKSGLFVAETSGLVGEQWYNHTDQRPTGDADVRTALTRALDLSELANVLTSGRGGPATTLAVNEPVACPGDSVSGSLPTNDPAAAADLLDAAGWAEGDDGVRVKDGKRLELTFLYQNNLGSSGDAAAELAVQQWKAIGADVSTKSQSETQLTGTIFGSGDWDISWVSLNVSSPDQLVPFLSGAVSPDGTNFSAIANSDYEASVGEAMDMDGLDSCDTWLGAESGLIEDADIVPFANSTVRTFGAGAEFETPGQLIPLSIRMVAP